jgi:hypothetical protein
MNAINKYLEKTNLHIRVVESSGYEFPIDHERFKQHTFTSTIDKNINFPTNGEIESIVKADESGILDGFDMVIKITGKYYVPELENELSKIPSDCGIVYQHGVYEENATNSEIFGCKKEYIKKIFVEIYKNDTYFEKLITNIHEKLGCTSYILDKKMKIECGDTCPHKTDKNILLKEL